MYVHKRLHLRRRKAGLAKRFFHDVVVSHNMKILLILGHGLKIVFRNGKYLP